ncbi:MULTISPECIES: delta-60 repeat domain-containing protein [Pseudomonas]
MLNFNTTLFSPGDLDPSFNGGAAKTLNFFYGDSSHARGVAVGRDGKIYMVGLGSAPGSNSTYYAIAAFENDGTISEDFNHGNILIDHFHSNSTSAGANSISLVIDEQGNEKILILGIADIAKDNKLAYCPAMARYHLDGTPDKSFGIDGYSIIYPSFEDGRFTFSFNGEASWHITQQRIYIVTIRLVDTGASSVVVCTDLKGRLDNTFGSEGIAIIINPDFRGGTQLEKVWRIDNSIYLGGVMYFGSPYSTVAKLNLDGSIDRGFGQQGFVVEQAYKADINSIGEQQSGKLLCAGRFHPEQEPGFVLYQGMLRSFNATGGINPEFNGGEPVFTQLGDATIWSSLVVQNDGRIVVAGIRNEQFPDLNYQHVLARFMPDGSFDSSFGRDGKGWIAFGRQGSGVITIAVQNNGAIIVAGSTSDYESQAYIVRFKG